MAYPEPIPPLSPKEGRQFLQRLREFSLSPKQRRFWSEPERTDIEP
jgi:hypothetical protein